MKPTPENRALRALLSCRATTWLFWWRLKPPCQLGQSRRQIAPPDPPPTDRSTWRHHASVLTISRRTRLTATTRPRLSPEYGSPSLSAVKPLIFRHKRYYPNFMYHSFQRKSYLVWFRFVLFLGERVWRLHCTKRKKERVLIECFGHDHAWQLKGTTREQTVCKRQRCTSLSFERVTSNATMPASSLSFNVKLIPRFAASSFPIVFLRTCSVCLIVFMFNRVYARYQGDARVSFYSHESSSSLSFLYFSLRYAF